MFFISLATIEIKRQRIWVIKSPWRLLKKLFTHTSTSLKLAANQRTWDKPLWPIRKGWIRWVFFFFFLLTKNLPSLSEYGGLHEIHLFDKVLNQSQATSRHPHHETKRMVGFSVKGLNRGPHCQCFVFYLLPQQMNRSASRSQQADLAASVWRASETSRHRVTQSGADKGQVDRFCLHPNLALIQPLTAPFSVYFGHACPNKTNKTAHRLQLKTQGCVDHRKEVTLWFGVWKAPTWGQAGCQRP